MQNGIDQKIKSYHDCLPLTGGGNKQGNGAYPATSILKRLSRYVSLLLLSLCVWLPAQAAVYKWVDKQGNVHFTDTPQKGAEEVKLKPLQEYKAPEQMQQPQLRKSLKALPKKPVVPNYSIAINTPRNNQVFFKNASAKPEVNFTIQPKLQKGHEVVIYIDSRKATTMTRSTGYVLNNVDRGRHTIQAKILDENGEVLATSNTTVFHMKQPTIKR